jgi:hypothetical protein
MEEKKLKSIRLIAMTLGIAGSAILLCSLFMTCCSLMRPEAWNISVSLLDYMNVKVMTAFGLVQMSLVFTLLNYGVPQIMSGSFVGIWAGLMCWKIMRKAIETTEYYSVTLGPGMYMFIFSATLIMTSGILLCIVPDKYKGFKASEMQTSLSRKLEVFCTASMGFSIVLFGVFELQIINI